MKVTNVNVYGIEESFKASKYPMSVNTDSLTPSITKTIKSLGACENGTGHDNFLAGIIVQYDLKCNHVMLPQFMRYNFSKIVSSQSKMHKIMDMDLEYAVDKYVNQTVLEGAKEELYKYQMMVEFGKDKYTKEEISEQYERVMSNLPMGLELTMRVSTNYLQLKTIHKQRKNHKMSFWREYCEWVESLPYFKELIGIEV